MLEDALRDTFAAKAGSAPPGSLDGVADAAIRGAHRIRRRRRVMAGGLAGVVAVALATIATLHVVNPVGSADQGSTATMAAPPEVVAEPTPTATQTLPPQAAREVDAIGGTAQPTKKVRLQLPDKGSVSAAYQASDGYLFVNTQPDGDKQLVLQDDNNKQQVLVDTATNITVDKNGGRVAWADQGKVTVASRGQDKKKGLTQSVSAPVPDDAVPVTFVGSDLVLGRSGGDGGFDVWYTSRTYTQAWDPSVVRVFGAHPDGKSLYAEIKPVAPETEDKKTMCLARLLLDQPFKVQDHECGLPRAARTGSRVSPDGRWLAYPVEGQKQVAIIDLTTIFTGGKPKVRDLTVTTKTVWLNATTFVVDNGTEFQALNTDGELEELDVASDGVVLIEPLYAG